MQPRAKMERRRITTTLLPVDARVERQPCFQAPPSNAFDHLYTWTARKQTIMNNRAARLTELYSNHPRLCEMIVTIQELFEVFKGSADKTKTLAKFVAKEDPEALLREMHDYARSNRFGLYDCADIRTDIAAIFDRSETTLRALTKVLVFSSEERDEWGNDASADVDPVK